MNHKFKLCCVREPWAWFTTQELDKQWGDDWDDAPYEHNAGEPYRYNEKVDADKEPWELFKLAFEVDMHTPCGFYLNSPYSVEQINAGVIAWLWNKDGSVCIHAGCDPKTFIETIRSAEGTVYLDPDGFSCECSRKI